MITSNETQRLAVETLDLLDNFCDAMASLSVQIADVSMGNRKVIFSDPRFSKLVDGTQTLVDAIQQIKLIFEYDENPTAKELEIDLTKILNSLLRASKEEEVGDSEVFQLLKNTFPAHLLSWRDSGLPGFISKSASS